MRAIILATRNRGKLAELSALLRGFDLQVRGLDEHPEIGDIAETGTTFAENALLKARAVCQATGLVAVADDSGLEVDALAGRPGVFSARYAGPRAADGDNNRKLLRELDGVADAGRTARFRCAVAACSPNGRTVQAEGVWEGRILRGPRGSMGFGYDPLFLDEETGLSAAELPPEVKNARSHRGKAVRALLQAWPAFWAGAAGGEPEAR